MFKSVHLGHFPLPHTEPKRRASCTMENLVSERPTNFVSAYTVGKDNCIFSQKHETKFKKMQANSATRVEAKDAY